MFDKNKSINRLTEKSLMPQGHSVTVIEKVKSCMNKYVPLEWFISCYIVLNHLIISLYNFSIKKFFKVQYEGGFFYIERINIDLCLLVSQFLVYSILISLFRLTYWFLGCDVNAKYKWNGTKHPFYRPNCFCVFQI